MDVTPSLSQMQLEILRIAKQSPDEILNLSFETPKLTNEEPPPGNPKLVQELVDLGLIEVYFKQSHLGTSRFQKDSWAEYCADLDLPSI